MKFQINNRWDTSVRFECELGAIHETSTRSVKLGAAVKIAVSKGAALRDADLRDAYLRDADLRDAALRGAALRGADLRDADLRDADLRDADLRGADLRGAYLRDADLRDAALRGADLRGAYLGGAYLGGADLRGADLRGAYLRGADLRGAYLGDKSKLINRRSIITIGPIGSEFRTIFAYITDKGIRVQAGCFFGDIEKFREAINDTHSENPQLRNEYLAACDFIDKRNEIWSKQ